jgi:hypothetical protein
MIKRIMSGNHRSLVSQFHSSLQSMQEYQDSDFKLYSIRDLMMGDFFYNYIIVSLRDYLELENA